MPQETNKPKRRFFRFSLRSFLIVVTILCVWLGWFLYRVEQQREVVRWVEENGGLVEYEYQYTSGGEFKNIPPPGPRWLCNILGVDYFSSVVNVYLDRSHRDDPLFNDLKPLASLTKLRRLGLEYCNVGDLTPLAGLTNLEYLGLANSQVKDLTVLAGLTNLATLYLSQTHVTDLTPLVALTSIKHLSLDNTQVSDLTPLAGLTNLEYLDLYSATKVSNVRPLASLTRLEHLSLGYTNVNEQELKKLKQALPNCGIDE